MTLLPASAMKISPAALAAIPAGALRVALVADTVVSGISGTTSARDCGDNPIREAYFADQIRASLRNVEISCCVQRNCTRLFQGRVGCGTSICLRRWKRASACNNGRYGSSAILPTPHNIAGSVGHIDIPSGIHRDSLRCLECNSTSDVGAIKNRLNDSGNQDGLRRKTHPVKSNRDRSGIRGQVHGASSKAGILRCEGDRHRTDRVGRIECCSVCSAANNTCRPKILGETSPSRNQHCVCAAGIAGSDRVAASLVRKKIVCVEIELEPTAVAGKVSPFEITRKALLPESAT